jgi:hypothetical protein
MPLKRDIDADRGMDDIRDIIYNQSVADLSWLAVDEKVYHDFEALPKQNFDTIPELQHALRQEPDERIPSLIPLRPHTMVNPKSSVSPQGVVDNRTPIRNRVASYVVSGLPVQTIGEKLRLEFPESELRNHVSTIKDVLNEKGLLGNVYLDSSNFPKCAQNGEDVKIATKHSKRALFVLAKNNCADCVCNNSGNCSSFKKRIVSEIPYNEQVFAHYASEFEQEGRDYKTTGDVKLRLKSAFNNSVKVYKESVQTIREQHPTRIEPTPEQVKDYLDRQASKKPEGLLPSPSYMAYARRMMAGHDDTLQLASSSELDLRKLVSEFGILGHTYLDMDALGGCRKTLAFLKSKDIRPEYIIRRSATCGICKCNKDGACAQISNLSKIVQTKLEVGRLNFSTALERAIHQGRISLDQARIVASNLKDDMNWVHLTSQMNRHVPPSEEVRVYDRGHQEFFFGSASTESSIKTNPEEIRKTISHLMNSGLRGRKLVAAIQSRYTKSDLVQVPEIGKFASENDGVQGFYFIDPTVYSDYGKGCVRGSSVLKDKSVPYIIAGSKCTGCTCQLVPGKCSKYARDIIRNVPDEVRIAAKRVALPVIQGPIENPVEKYELGNEIAFEVKSTPSNKFEIKYSVPDPEF